MMDSIEVRAPGFAALAVRLLLRLPSALRVRLLTDAFDRAERAFNRGDLAAVFALFSRNVEYVPPPALHSGAPIVGRTAVQRFWEDVLTRFDENTIANVWIEEARPEQFVRTARLSHRTPQGTLAYTIRQITELDRGRVVRQVNEQLDGSSTDR